MPWRLIVDVVGFQSVWWACALGAGAGRWEPGVGLAAIVSAGQVLAAAERKALVATLLVAAVLGVVGESVLVAAGLVEYAASVPSVGLAPLWIVALWVVCATCAPATERMLGAYGLLKVALLGLVVAPPTYWAGESFGALAFASPRWQAMLATGIVWMIAMPILIAVYRRCARGTGQPAGSADRSA